MSPLDGPAMPPTVEVSKSARIRWPQIKLAKWGWYADVPLPFTGIWLICDAGCNWEIGWRRDR